MQLEEVKGSDRGVDIALNENPIVSGHNLGRRSLFVRL